MDEMWQRHKSFILQVVVGGVLFLVAFFVMRSIYGGDSDPKQMETRNRNQLDARRKQLDEGRAPSRSSIADQQRIAKNAEDQRHDLERRVGSTGVSEADYVKDSVTWTCANIEKLGTGVKLDPATFSDLYSRIPQACLSRLRDAARNALVGRAAQYGMEIDETLGLGMGFQDDEIPAALHALAVVSDVVGRCFPKAGEEHPRIDRVLSIKIDPHDPFPEQIGVGFVSALGVQIDLVGDPRDVAELIRSFNSTDNPARRMTVVKSVNFLTPVSPDEDTVRLSVSLVGLRFKAEGKAGAGPEGQ